MAMQYEETVPMSRNEADLALDQTDDTYSLCYALLCVALHENDWRWALTRVVPFLVHSNPEVRKTAVKCIGYLARIHRTLDVSRAMPTLQMLREDAYCARPVRAVLEDIRQYGVA
jgi:hypothetical protein